MVKKTDIDKIDVRLLQAVQSDARLTLADLAQLGSTSTSSAARRLKRLEEEGIITGYSANVDPAGLGFVQDIFVEVTLTGQDEKTMDKFERGLAGIRQVLSCWLMSGESDYLVRVVARDAPDYEHIHRTLSKLPGVHRLRSSFALRQVFRRQMDPQPQGQA
jgi:DNA-binding Lrp family transcriptional regulator